jgi:hypothetical protein
MHSHASHKSKKEVKGKRPPPDFRASDTDFFSMKIMSYTITGSLSIEGA